MSSSVIEIDVTHIEHEALRLFLDSVKREFNNRFSLFSASVDISGRLPQLTIREDGKLR